MPLPMFSKPQGPKNRIAIAAGKGGVGKSTVTVNLALTLQRQGYQVGILDADIYGPSIRMMLPEDRIPAQRGERIIPALSRGMEVISMAYFRQEHEAAVVRAPIANSLVTQFMNRVEWGELDYLLIDFPPGTGDVQLTLSQQANLTGAVMVSTPQQVSVLDVRKAMRLFDQVRVPVVGLVENMSYYQPEGSSEPQYLFGRGGGEALARETGTPLLGKIPIDPLLCRSADEGKSIFSYDAAPSIPAFEAFKDSFLENLERVKQQKEVVRELRQEEKALYLQWEDGQEQRISYSELQRRCPCASCVDEATGNRLLDERSVDENLGARSLERVGRYAIRIDFTSGCSHGIYDFDLLREMQSQPAGKL